MIFCTFQPLSHFVSRLFNNCPRLKLIVLIVETSDDPNRANALSLRPNDKTDMSASLAQSQQILLNKRVRLDPVRSNSQSLGMDAKSPNQAMQ